MARSSAVARYPTRCVNRNLRSSSDSTAAAPGAASGIGSAALISGSDSALPDDCAEPFGILAGPFPELLGRHWRRQIADRHDAFLQCDGCKGAVNLRIQTRDN